MMPFGRPLDADGGDTVEVGSAPIWCKGEPSRTRAIAKSGAAGDLATGDASAQ